MKQQRTAGYKYPTLAGYIGNHTFSQHIDYVQHLVPGDAGDLTSFCCQKNHNLGPRVNIDQASIYFHTWYSRAAKLSSLNRKWIEDDWRFGVVPSYEQLHVDASACPCRWGGQAIVGFQYVFPPYTGIKGNRPRQNWHVVQWSLRTCTHSPECGATLRTFPSTFPSRGCCKGRYPQEGPPPSLR